MPASIMPSEDVLIDGPSMPAKAASGRKADDQRAAFAFWDKKPPVSLTLTRFQPFIDSSIFGRLGPAAFTQSRLRPAAGASSFKPKSYCLNIVMLV
jgi:hypothetical protein